MLGLTRDYYYTEIPLPAMETFLEHARRRNWSAVFESGDSVYPWSFILGSHFNPSRSSWIFTTNLKRDNGRRALDFGSGWGVNAVGLAPYFSEVVAAELSWHRLLSLRLLSETLGLDNITPICGGDTPQLPFPAGHFDLVVLNGVIEWIPVGQPGNPRQHQIRFLREIARILKPDGELFLASENRYAYQYWVGQPDDHTHLLFGSLLPRPIANIYSKLKNNKPYQNYTYSVSQYKQLLGEAGFRATEFHGLLPSHRAFWKIFPLAKGRICDLEETRGSTLKNLFLRRPEVTRLASALGMRATQTQLSASYLERLCSHLNRQNLLPCVLEPQPYKLLATNFSAKVGIKTTDGSAAILVKIPLCTLKKDLQTNAIREQRRWNTSEMVGQYVSPILAEIDFEESELTVESLCLSPHTVAPKREPLYAQIEQVLLTFARTLGPGAFVQSWSSRMEELLSCLGPEHRELIDRLRQHDQVRNLPSCYQHGDFHSGNLLTVKNKELAMIIDWEWATQDGVPLYDVFHFMTNHDAIQFNNRSLAILKRLIDGDQPNPSLRRMTERLLKHWQLSQRDLGPLALVYVYDTLYKHWKASAAYLFRCRFLTADQRELADQLPLFAQQHKLI